MRTLVEAKRHGTDILIRTLKLGASVAMAAALLGACAQPKPAFNVVASSGIAIAETQSGRVQGFVRGGVTTFRGIPYATAERFMAPKPPTKWEGVRQTLSYGHICPQAPNDRLQEPQTFVSDNRFWPSAEACQNLNIWTPAVDGKRRPVMVWLHGGGFSSGSSNELPLYDGTNLSRAGDVVVVSINHRLNVLGFLDLSAYGPKYKDSANAGMLDIVAALQWVRDNIGQFGGDPSNVTIFGQSGGGGKVATLMTVPSATGLYRRAIIQSGAPGADGRSGDQRAARRVGELTLENAGLAAADVDKLAAVPYERLLEASTRAQATAAQEAGRPGGAFGAGMNWGPVVDGVFLPTAPFGEAAPEASRGIPLMVGSTLSEFAHFQAASMPGFQRWAEADLLAHLRKTRGADAEKVLAEYKRAYPELGPGVWPLIDANFRAGALRAAEFKAAQGDPVYAYVFAYRSPVLDYAWAAGHSAELAFTFNNAEAGEQSSGGGAAVARLTSQISQAWINFARTGDPYHGGLTRWPRYTQANPATMIFDNDPDVRIGHDAELVALIGAPPGGRR